MRVATEKKDDTSGDFHDIGKWIDFRRLVVHKAERVLKENGREEETKGAEEWR